MLCPEQLQAPLDGLLPPEEQVGLLGRERGQTGIGLRAGSGGVETPLATTAAISSAPPGPEHVGPERDEVHSGWQRHAHDVGRRRRQQDLTGLGELADACGAIQRRSEDVAVDADELTGGHADPD